MPAPKRRRASPEAALHRAVASYLRVALPEDAVWTTFPAGGGGRVRGAQLKAAGLMAGWPDIQILWANPPYGPDFFGIELKAKAGRLSPEQRECHARIASVEGRIIVARSVAEVEAGLRDNGVPLRASVTP